MADEIEHDPQHSESKKETTELLANQVLEESPSDLSNESGFPSKSAGLSTGHVLYDSRSDIIKNETDIPDSHQRDPIIVDSPEQEASIVLAIDGHGLQPVSTFLRPATWLINEPKEPWCPVVLQGLEERLGIKDEYNNELYFNINFGGDWLLAAATKRGRMHAHHGTHREDALWGSLNSRFSFACVCDGAGSSKLSRVGSEFTVRTLSRLVHEELVKYQSDILNCSRESLPVNLRAILNLCVDTVARELIGLACKSEMEPKDFRCTVLTALHYRHPTGGIFLFGNVGDGFLAVKRKGRKAERIGTSDSGAFSGEVTCFMPDPQVTEFYRTSLDNNPIIADEDVEAYMMCTDGIEDPFFPIHRTVDEIFSQLFEGFQKPINDVRYPEGAEPSSIINASAPGEELLKWLSFEKRGENDDRTISLIYRKSLLDLPKEGSERISLNQSDLSTPTKLELD